MSWDNYQSRTMFDMRLAFIDRKSRKLTKMRVICQQSTLWGNTLVFPAFLDKAFSSQASIPDVNVSLDLKGYDATRSMTPLEFQNKTECNEVTYALKQMHKTVFEKPPRTAKATLSSLFKTLNVKVRCWKWQRRQENLCTKYKFLKDEFIACNDIYYHFSCSKRPSKRLSKTFVWVRNLLT